MIRYLIIHCTATRRSQRVSVADIDRWHRAQGWNGCGYHYVITPDGTIHPARPVYEAGAHCRGYNTQSIGIVYTGGLTDDGLPADTRTEAQRLALRTLLHGLRRLFPDAKIVGHRDLNPAKQCPCFDASHEFRGI